MNDNASNSHSNQPPPGRIVAAFVALYLIWGSTYLAMRVTVETMPPLLMAGARFIIAGVLMHLWVRLRGAARPTRLHWRNSAIAGVLLLLGGNGLIVVAEKTITSGLAALLVAVVPLWIALLDWLQPQGKRPDAKNILGILVGLTGMAMLVKSQHGSANAGETHWAGIGMVIVAGILWAWGSLFMRYNDRPASPMLGVSMQMICGGLALLLAGMIMGELRGLDWRQFSDRSLIAFAWLVVAGAWIGFSAYIWLMQVSTPSRVATYAYVNPIIAVFLGWLLLGETVTGKTIGAAAVILAGVVIITTPVSMLRKLLSPGRHDVTMSLNRTPDA